MKKLIPALAMLLIAAVMLGTSTYAWFSMNTQVTATGMTVKAATSKNLVISTDSTLNSNEDVSATHAFNGKVAVLKPTSTQTLAGSQNFFKVTDASAQNVVYASGVANDGTVFEAATVNATTALPGEATFAADVVKYTFYIRADGEADDSFAKLYVKSITLNGGAALTKNISKALRVGVVCGSYGYIYEPVTGSTASYKGVVAAGTVGTDSVISGSNVTISTVNTPADTLGEVLTTAYLTVDVYVWYEGQDGACTSANSINVEEIAISVLFEAAAA